MQTIRIIIVKRKLNYVKLKNEVTMTTYNSNLEVETSANLLLFLKLFRQSLFRSTEQYLWHKTIFYLNADNAAARKPRDRRSASCSSIPDLQWFNKLFNGAMASNVKPSCRPGLGLVNTIFAESWEQYGGNIFSVIQLFWSTLLLTLQTDIYIFPPKLFFCHRVVYLPSVILK